MNRIAIVGAIAVLAAVPACTVCGKVTASRDYVDEKVASATNALRSEIETEIESVAPAGYEIVSNRAMSAVQLELDVKTNRTSLTVGIDRQGEIGANSVVFGAISSATGTSSFAHGYGARAYGENSHAEGVSTLAAGVNSHAEGNASTARGGSSHAEGSVTLTEGYYSHAEGMASEAHGTASHAEGSFTKASGEGSHSEGSNTVATNKYAHAEGFRTGAYGIGSHAEGYNTFARGKYSHASGMSAYANDDYSYVWGGYDDPRGAQASKGSGSFCVYPLLGISGFYIDGKNLRSIIYEESAVTKVNDRVGDVSLTADDVGALPVNKGGSWTLGVLESETNIAEAATLKIVGGGSSGGSLIIDSYIGAYPGKLEVHGHDGRAFRVEETGPYMGSCEINGSKISLKSAGRGYSSFASMIEMPSVHLGSVVYSDILLNEVSVWDKINSLTNIENDISFIKDNAAIAEKDSSGSRTAFMFGAWPSSWTNKVSGFGALSQGFASYASNQYSHAEGYQTVAEGLASHAEGNRTKATGTYSHAEGQATVASGNSSHADGYRAVASNEYSYAWSGTRAGGGSHGDGTFSIYPNGGISGFYIDGKSLDTIIAESSVTRAVPSSAGNKIRAEYEEYYSPPTLVVDGDSTSGGLIKVNGAPGGKSISIEAGAGEGGGQASLTVGDYTRGVKLLSPVTTAMFEADAEIRVGTDSTGVKICDFSGATEESEGYPAIKMMSDHNDPKILVNGTDIVTLAKNSLQKNTNGSFVVGNVGYPPGEYALANGNMVSATNIYAHAEGIETYAFGAYSHAEGDSNFAKGDGSHTEGCETIAEGVCAHAEGRETIASGETSHAEGDGAKAIGRSSHAEGFYTKAIGDCSHAEGSDSIAEGDYSHAGGVKSHAVERWSYAWCGENRATTNLYKSHGVGTYNVNPEGGLSGFWIGNNNLPYILSNDVGRISSPDGSRAIDAYGNVIDTTGYPGDFSVVSNVVGLALVPDVYTNASENTWLADHVNAENSPVFKIAYEDGAWYTMDRVGTKGLASRKGASIDDDEVRLYASTDTNELFLVLTRTGRHVADTAIDKVAFESSKISVFTNDAGYLKKDSQVVMGEGSSVVGNDVSSIVIGYDAVSISDDSDGEVKPRQSNICIGSLAGASGTHAVAIGPTANAYNGSVAIGSMAGAGGVQSYSAVAIGMGAKFHGDKTVTLGTVASLDSLYLGDTNLQALIDAEISQSNETFSSAVLAVGLNIDTNSVAVLNEIASAFGGFPIEGTATTVGGLLAALAAAIAWLKRNKADKTDVDTLAAKVGDANEKLEEVA